MEDSKIIKTIINSYDINISSIKLLRRGGCVSYCIWGENEKYLMKIISSAFMDTAKQSLNILCYLQEEGFPSPHIVYSKNGKRYIEVDTPADKTLWVIFDYIEGREPDEGEDLEVIGALVGRLHSVMQEYKGSLPEHGKEYFIDRYINILKRKGYDANKTKIFQEYGDNLWNRVKNLPRGFCHGDLHRGNLLKMSSGEYFLLDFDTSCRAFPMYDIMIMCNETNYFNYDENGYKKITHAYKSFLKGYSKYCTPSEMELKAFYDLIAIYHYQLQATIIEINGLDCVDNGFLDKQLDWLMKWREQCIMLRDI